jgi:hypothetical protein
MKRILRSAALLVAVMFAVSVPAAASGPRVGKTVNITNDGFADNEESFGMSPDGTLLAGSWNDFDFNDGCGFSYSTTSGSTWAPRTFVPGFTSTTNDPNLPGTGSFPEAGDPAVAYNPRFGTFDVVCQAFGGGGGAVNLLATTFNPALANPEAGENASYTSPGHQPWTRPVAVASGASNGTEKGSNGHFPDHDFITVDTGTGPGHHFGRLFATWAEFDGSGKSPAQLAYSDDNGIHWSGPVTVSDANHKFDQDVRGTVAPDGAIYVSFTGGPNETSTKGNFVGIARSTDGGASFGPTAVAAAIVAPITGLLPNSLYRVFTDAYSTPNTDGSVTVVWNDGRNGASQIFATHGAADLSAWSAPTAVEPPAAGAAPREQFFPWLETSPGGRLDLAFYDRSNDRGDTLNWVTYASSTDDGATWTNTTATSQGVDLDRFQSCLAFAQPPNCGVYFIGDYIGLTSTDASVHLFYTWNGPAAQDVFETSVTP